MRKSGHINALAHQRLQSFIQAGISTAELNSIAESVIREHHGFPSFRKINGFPTAISVCVNEEVGHGIPSHEKRLAEGDVVTVDIGVEYEGYNSDCAHTYIVGQGNASTRHLVSSARNALNNGISAAQQGARISDISHAIFQTVQQSGLSIVKKAFGHGIGRSLHEEPRLPNFGPPNRGSRLREGMTLAVEPVVVIGSPTVRQLNNGWTDVTIDGSLSAHVEHTILITKRGPEIITVLPSDHEQIGTLAGMKLPQIGGGLVRPKSNRDDEAILALAQAEMNPVLIETWGRLVRPEEVLIHDAVTLVITDAEERLAGFYTYSEQESSIYLHTVVIHSQHQGRGIGKLIMNSLVELARQRGVSQLALQVQINNRRAVDFYRNLGFVPTGEPRHNTQLMQKMV